MKRFVSLIGVPMWLGQTRYGTNLGPSIIRTCGLYNKLSSIGLNVIDYGDIVVPPRNKRAGLQTSAKNVKQIAKASEKLAHVVSKSIRNKYFPLIIGGDHSISIGTIAGLSKTYNNLGVIWYDAHADMNTPLTTPSGNVHGMPLAVSMGLGHSTLTNVGGSNPKIKAENIVLIGARDIDDGERLLIREKNIKVFSAEDVYRYGIEKVIDESVSYLSRKCDGIHLSFDLDGVAPEEAPGVGTPVSNGISFKDSITAMKMLEEIEVLSSAEFVEVNPLLDEDNITSMMAVSLAAALLGDVASESGRSVVNNYENTEIACSIRL